MRDLVLACGVLLGAGCDGALADPATVSVKRHMQGHVDAVREIHNGVVRGRLDVVRKNAKWIADREPHPDLASWKLHSDAVRASARALADTTDLALAAKGAASLAHNCAACHEARAAVVTFAWEAEPTGQDAVAGAMARHRWATARLWEGLVGPSDELWLQGARGLASSELDVSAIAARGDRVGAATAAARLRELAGNAQRSKGSTARAALYGELLSTCAGCHSATRDPSQLPPNTPPPTPLVR
jgi:cytochrome c553